MSHLGQRCHAASRAIRLPPLPRAGAAHAAGPAPGRRSSARATRPPSRRSCGATASRSTATRRRSSAAAPRTSPRTPSRRRCWRCAAPSARDRAAALALPDRPQHGPQRPARPPARGRGAGRGDRRRPQRRGRGAERREELTELMERLRALPEPQRAAIVMRELEGLSHEEIAAALGVSGGAARQAIYRARQALRDGLGLLLPLPLLQALLGRRARGGRRRRCAAARRVAGGAASAAGAALKAGDGDRAGRRRGRRRRRRRQETRQGGSSRAGAQPQARSLAQRADDADSRRLETSATPSAARRHDDSRSGRGEDRAETTDDDDDGPRLATTIAMTGRPRARIEDDRSGSSQWRRARRRSQRAQIVDGRAQRALSDGRATGDDQLRQLIGPKLRRSGPGSGYAEHGATSTESLRVGQPRRATCPSHPPDRIGARRLPRLERPGIWRGARRRLSYLASSQSGPTPTSTSSGGSSW